MTTFLSKYERLTQIRATDPGAIRRAADARTRAPLVPSDGRLMIIACDHPARGANGVADRPLAMANRGDLLDRLQTALSRPGSTACSAARTSSRTCCCSVPWRAR